LIWVTFRSTYLSVQDVIASVSIGGWTGSRWFSCNVASAENRTAFVGRVIDLVTKYDLDAVDFEYVFITFALVHISHIFPYSWEYPDKQGLGCNTISPKDTADFLLFLQELRNDTIGSKLILSAATSITPFTDASGSPSKDVSAFSEVLDYIAVMNYDIWGSWSATVGPNAPLDDTCAPPAAQIGSAFSAIQAWSSAGMPLDQIVLGVPSYGHSFYVSEEDAFVSGSKTVLATYPPFDKSRQPKGDRWDGGAGVDACGQPVGIGGNWDYWGLIEGGFLDESGNVASGIIGNFDNCSQTVRTLEMN
jgi:chitinase